MEYRHELKFLVSDFDLEVIRYRLKPLMKSDIHQKDEYYSIRSLYFDDLYDSCMKENEDGVDNRRKYRIRIYNGSDDVIKLEKKIKCRDMTRKESVSLSRGVCEKYISGKISCSKNFTNLEKELLCEIKMKFMHPKSIVEYERTAFVEPRGNVRITFDRNISGCSKVDNFFDKKLSAVPLLPKGQQILEVKYDELLPSYLTQVLEMGTLQRTSFSKYYYSRNAMC